MSHNTIIIEDGKIGKNPELRYGKANNTPFLTISVCTADSWWDKNKGEWEDESNWFDVKFFGKAAEKAAEQAVVGGRVFLRGHVKLEQWKDKDGQNRYKHVVIPDMGHVYILPPAQRDNDYEEPHQERRDSSKRQQTSQGSRGRQYDDGPEDDSDIPF